MKKLLFSAAALSGVFAFSSCSSDEPMANGAGNDAVSFRVEIPASLASRATFGDESMVSLNNLQWAVYDMTDVANPALVFNGANDTGEPFADYIRIKGGKYNKATYSQRTKAEIPAYKGYKWQPINEAPFTLQVVKQ